MKHDSSGRQSWLLAIAVVVLAAFPIFFVKGEYTGSDAQAEGAINELSPDYKPWFTPFFEPPSGEVASLLFASQAALGAGVIGYVIGLYKGRSENRKKDER
ncbi:MAG: energy-coupling factor ABC transporter substrate-binding protein [Lyngbya sp. HA4199-MV5]|jgi:cobalt/nickel transport protein|nr:energy-coupling factor ABC transporter substrate-binding protein [Lyngbya sp. HA4199-MV5]